ncbi:hypothetical protein ACFVH6_25645 [Spirillospora sp. NPDC127200]
MTKDEKAEAWDAGYKAGVHSGREALQRELDRRNRVARHWNIDATWGGLSIRDELDINHMIIREVQPVRNAWRTTVPCCLRKAVLPELEEYDDIGLVCCRCGIVYTVQVVPRYAAGFEDWEGDPLVSMLVDKIGAVIAKHRG